MEPRLDGPERHAEQVRDLLKREVLPESQTDHDPLVGVQDVHQLVDLVPGQRGSERVIGVDRQFVVEFLYTDAATLAQPVAADVDQNPIEPRLETVLIAKCGPGLPAAGQRILDGILGLGGIAKKIARQTVGIVEDTFGEVDERHRKNIGEGECRLHRGAPPCPIATNCPLQSSIQTKGATLLFRLTAVGDDSRAT
jgi:hypothetical protein